MTAARYLLAKYIPDLFRGEPRNVGVVLWSESGVVARFIGEKPGLPGQVISKRIPPFVGSRESYRQWVAYWQCQLKLVTLKDRRRPGTSADRSNPEYLDILAGTSRGNYILTAAGELLDPVSDPRDAVNYLFKTLVQAPVEPAVATLDSVCESLIERFKLRDDPHFKTSFPVPCQLPGGVSTDLGFSYAYKNGSLHRLYQQVPFRAGAGRIRAAVNQTALKFQRVAFDGNIDRDRAVSLVYLDPQSKLDDDHEHLLRVLGTVSRVVDVAREEAEQEFAGLAKLSALSH